MADTHAAEDPLHHEEALVATGANAGGATEWDAAGFDANLEVENTLFTMMCICALIHIVVYGGCCVSREQHSSQKTTAGKSLFRSGTFRKLALTYLPVFLLATFADWMTGPYIYALYESYGYTIDDIGTLFVAGFGSSLVFGTVIGSLGDRFGRRQSCALYCIIMAVACLLKNSPDFYVLIMGRVCGGVATSLLYSAFEAWVASEFTNAGLQDELPHLFSIATFGNAAGAVVAGLFANNMAEHHGFTAPFNIAIVPLGACLVVIAVRWQENYGAQGLTSAGSFHEALAEMSKNHSIVIVGLISALFEASLYIFVFVWTPSLQARAPGQSVPLGRVFALYMVSKMCGTGVMSCMSRFFTMEELCIFMLFLAGAALMMPYHYTESFHIALYAQVLFEFCVGMYWPCIMSLRGKYVSERTRSTTFNLFRMPLNALVIGILLRIESLPETAIYCLCGATLWVACLLAWALKLRTEAASTASRTINVNLESASPPSPTHIGAGGFTDVGRRSVSPGGGEPNAPMLSPHGRRSTSPVPELAT